MTELLLLAWEFFKTGLFAVGGGLATIPFLTQMSAQYPQWFTLSELADMIAVSESTPGPIGVNMATYAGYKVAGILGAITTSLSIVLPSFLILLIIARVLQKYRENRYVNAAFAGLRPAVTGLIAAAGFSVLKLAVAGNGTLDVRAAVLFAILFACTQIKQLKKLHPIVYIGAAAVVGVALKL